MVYVYVLNRNMNTFYWNNSKFRNIFYVYSLRLWLVKIRSIHSLNMNWNTVFLNSYIYWNGMFFLTIICIYFIETTQNCTIFWYMYFYQLVTFLTILKITAFLVIFWNVFIHSHGEWSVKCRERQTKFQKSLKYNDNYNYPEDPVFQYPHLIETTTCIDFYFLQKE